VKRLVVEGRELNDLAQADPDEVGFSITAASAGDVRSQSLPPVNLTETPRRRDRPASRR
jgi:hypothetical protein